MKKITFNLLLGIGLLLSSAAMNAQANDNFANAEAITCGNNYSGTTVGATLDEDNAPDGFGADMDAPNVWYSYTGSGSPETVTLNLCNSSYDTSVLVYTGTSGNLTLVIANDDDNTCGAALTTRSRLSFNSDGATTYYIAIEGWNATSTGAFTMDVTCDAVNPPAVDNQTCLTALNLEVDASILTSDNSFGDVTSTQPTCDLFGSIQDVWFSFVAPSATVDCNVTKGTMASANFAIYSGTCDALVSLACNSNLTNPFTQSLTTLTPGETYYVQVWSNGAEQGDFTISLSDPSVCLPTATFEKVANCPADSTFNVNVDVTGLASASSVTITDNQSSAPQTVSSAGVVSFGPYAFGTSVILTVTNDQSPGCALVSPAQTFLACPPANDECSNAIALTVNPDFSCTEVTAGTIAAASASNTDTASCGGTEDDDVWFSFVATNATHTVSLLNVAGSTTDLFHSLWTGADCASLTLVPNSCSDPNNSTINGLTPGETYYLRVYSWTATVGQTSTFDVCIGTPPPPPANDECDGAIALTVNSDAACTEFTSGTVASATPSNTDTAACGGTEDDDVWFSFVATNESHYINLSNVAGSTTDLFHSVWTGDCAGLTLVPNTCSDPNNSMATGLTPGNTYYLRVYTYTGTAGQTSTFDVCIGTPPPPPANDECDGAIALTVNPDMGCASFESGTIASATASSVDAAACGGTEDDDVWFSFVANETIQTITLSNVVGSTTDLYHSLWTGDCGALTLVPGTCSDPNASTPTGLTPGQTYYVRVYSYTATAGQTSTFDICIGTPPPPPANDDCTGAIEVIAGGEFTTSPIVSSNLSATSTVGLPTFSCQTNRSNDVWYTVVAPDSGTLTVETDAAPGTLMTDSVVSVYRGTCGSLTEIGCDDDAGNGNFSKVVLSGLTPGETLYIGVWRYGTTADGDFQLSAYDASLLANESFQNSEGFKVYPNPVKNLLNLSYNKNITNVAVYNLLGQQVIAKSTNANLSQIDMSHLVSGTYFVKVTADNQTKTIKVVKE